MVFGGIHGMKEVDGADAPVTGTCLCIVVQCIIMCIVIMNCSCGSIFDDASASSSPFTAFCIFDMSPCVFSLLPMMRLL